jgi:hypothetical protein
VIAAEHSDEFLPIMRTIIGARCGIVISTINATMRMNGDSSNSQIQRPNDASGRDRWTLITMAGMASAKVTRNFVSKNGLRIADMKSGRMPSVTSNIAATTGSVTNKAIASCVLTGRGL